MMSINSVLLHFLEVAATLDGPLLKNFARFSTLRYSNTRSAKVDAAFAEHGVKHGLINYNIHLVFLTINQAD
jgi:hypothetical protein